MRTSELVLLLVLTLCWSLIGTDSMRRLARRFGLVAPPRTDRWHRRPTALFGGVGFFPSFAIAWLWIFYRHFGLEWFPDVRALPREGLLMLALAMGASMMFATGLWDDVRHAKPVTKLLFQVIAASLFVTVGGIFPLSGVFLVDTLLTYLWFIGIINAVNMLDNMDGLAPGVVILASVTLVVLAGAPGTSGEVPITVSVGLVFVASLAGFLAFNYPPASIFMGDSGSLFIGFVLAALAIPSALNGFLSISTGTPVGAALVLLIPATVLAVPIFDTTLVTVTRKWRARRASEGGRDHSSHRLVGLGLPETLSVWILYLLAGFGGLTAVLLQRYPHQTLPLLALFASILVLSGVYLGRVKMEPKPTDHSPAWTPLVSELFFKRRFAEGLLDLALVIACFYGAYLLRFDGVLIPETVEAVASALPVVVPVCLTSFYVVGFYRGQWHLISVSDIPTYAMGAAGGAGLSLASVTLVTRFGLGHSRGAYIIFGLLLFLATAGSRLSFRMIDALVARQLHRTGDGPGQAILVYGAGRAGKLLFEEITSNPEFRAYRVRGFVDDDPQLVGKKLCGLLVEKPAAWAHREWLLPPEIWISSQKVSDENAQGLAAHWRGEVRIRRLRIHLEPLARDQPSKQMFDN